MGIGNTLRSDDGVGSLLATRLQDKTPYIVYDAGSSPENYLGKIIKVSKNTAVIEAMGEQEQIKELLEGLQTFGVKELIRTGKIAIAV